MRQGRPNLKASSALPLVLGAIGGALGGALAAAPALANCAGGLTVTCDTASPNPYTSTVGSGRNDHNRTVNVLGGGRIVVTNKNAISLGDNARINLASGALVQGTANAGGDGQFGTGMQPIEFNSYGLLVVGEGARVIEHGTDNRAEAVNVHGVGNRIVNHGLISGQSSAAIWFEDEIKTGPRNMVDNYGTIQQTGGGAVIGTSGGSGIDFFNQTGARVEGDLIFAGGDDNLFFFADSTVTGSIDGGAGDNGLTLEGALGSSDTLSGGLTNFQTLAKDGLGRWTITSSLSGFRSTTVRLGTLALTGNNIGYAAGVGIDAGGILEARAQSLPVQSDPANNLDNIRNNGLLRFEQDDDGTYVGQVVGAGIVEKTGTGVTTLAPSAAAGNTYAGGTALDQGTLAVAADSALGAAAGGLSFDGGTLRTTAGFAMARAATLHAAGGTFEPTTGTLIENAAVSGAGRLTKTGAGTLALTAANSYAGGTQIDAGTVEVAADASLGAAAGTLGFDGGTLRTMASTTTARATTLAAGGGSFETAAGTLTHTGTVAGPGMLTKTGPGTLALASANTYSGGTALNGGVVQVGANANLGAAAGTLSFDGGTLLTTASIAMSRGTTLAAGGGTFATATATEFTQAGGISGSGGLAKTGGGVMVLTGAATHGGGTTIAAGTLRLGNGGTEGSLAGNVRNDAALVFDRSDQLDIGGIISGTGTVTQAGTGLTRLAGANVYSGATTVESGALYVNGNQAGATGTTTAGTGSTLGGSGKIGGDVTVADGATLVPGDVGDTPGTLTIGGGLALGAGAVLQYGFGQANVPGGPLNDVTVVGGDLTLDGTLEVTVSPGGSFDPGVYRVFDYAGRLTDHGLAIGTIPATDFRVQTSISNQVNLVNTTGLTLNFWDGDAGPKNDGAVNGGDGAWQSSAGNDDWTEVSGLINAPFSDGAFAIFTGAPGTVTVDDSLGDVTVAGMQFAVDGYVVEGEPITLVGATGSVARVGDGTPAGREMTATIAAELTGASQLVKSDLGTLVLAGANSYTGGTSIIGGVLEVAEDASLGDAAGALSFDAGTLRTTAAFTIGRAATLEARGGTIETAAGTLTLTGSVGGPGALDKTGPGTLVLDAVNGYAGGTNVNGGTVEVAADVNLGAAAGPLGVDGGTLRATASFAMDRDATLGAGGGTIATGAGITLAQAGDTAGVGLLSKTGAGTLVMTGTGSHAGGTAITAGTLQLGDGGTAGSLAGDIANYGTLVLNRSDDFALAGVISGTGAVRHVGDGTTTLAGANSYAGGTEIDGGAIGVAADANLGAAAGPLSLDGGTLTTTASFATARATTLEAGGGTFATTTGILTHDGVVEGAGALAKVGAGTLVLSGANSYAGETRVRAGTLIVDGDQTAATGATTAEAGSTLGGIGTIGGDVTIADGATLSPGRVGPLPGTLSIAGNLTLAPAAAVEYSLGEAQVVGGTLNDLTVVGGDLTLDGTLDVAITPGGSFDPGVYRVISYAGALTDNGLAIGTIPAPDFFVQTSIANQVNLVTAAGLTLDFWDGDAGSKENGAPDGGDGTWQGSAGNDHWTDATGAINAPFSDGAFAVFGGAAGKVTVDNSLGDVSVSGMQFTTDGYAIGGEPIALVGASQSIVRVGDGTAAGAGVTATISAALIGASGLRKTDLGTLVLAGTNSYSGGTAIDGGVVEIASEAGLGAAGGGISFDTGTLRATSDLTLTRATTLEAGGGTLETRAGVTLTQQSGITGSGALTKAGAGTVVMTGAGSYTGGTTIAAGTLEAGASGAFSAGSAHVVDASGTLQLADFDQRVERLSNAGRVALGHVSGTRLTVTGDYVGQGGVLHFTTELAGDASRTDLLEVQGDTSGTGLIEVTNDGGGGAQTVDGIKIIDVDGASNATFTLAGNTVLDGRPVVIGGAFVYSLWKNGVADPTDGDWYLRSQSTVQPGPPLVQPGVPVYEAYPRALLALNGLPTMQERMGNRYWKGAGDTALPAGGPVEDRRAWARVEGARVGLQPDVDFGGRPDYAMDVWKLQVGMDRALHETDDGLVIAGLTFSYGTVDTDVSSDAGDGSIATDGYGFGGSLTWLRDDDLYVDGQAQLMWYDSDLASADLDEGLASGNDGFGYALGVEVGRRIPVRPGWTVTPQGQVVYSSVDFNGFTDPFGADVGGDEGAGMPVRLGVSLDQESGWKGEGGDGRRRHVYGIANLYYDVLPETEVRVGGTGLTSSGDRVWGSLGVGGTLSWADGRYAVYGEGLVSSSLANLGDSYANSATVGLRIAW